MFLPRSFGSHEYLVEFGLYHMNARLYDPVTGRFLSPDPYIQDLNNFQNYNPYTYCLNNPLKYTDPTGEFFLPIILGAVTGGVMGAVQAKMNGKQWYQYSTPVIPDQRFSLKKGIILLNHDKANTTQIQCGFQGQGSLRSHQKSKDAGRTKPAI